MPKKTLRTESAGQPVRLKALPKRIAKPAESLPERFCFSSEESEVHFCQGLTLFDAIQASVFSCIERLIGTLN